MTHTDAHAVKAAGDLVALGVELAAGMQLGHHHFGCRDALLLMHVHRDPAAVVDHGDRVVDVDGDVDLGAVACQGLINGVVHDLVDQVVQADLASRADVHRGPQAHCFQALKHFDAAGIVDFARRSDL